jgi:hypothetical protein
MSQTAPCHPRFAIPQARRLYRWRPDQGYLSLVREGDDAGDRDDLHECDATTNQFVRVAEDTT